MNHIFKRISLTCFIAIFIPFMFFCCLNAQRLQALYWIKEVGVAILVSFMTWENKMLLVCLHLLSWYTAFVILKHAPSIHKISWTFIIQACYLLSNTISVPLEIIVCFCHYVCLCGAFAVLRLLNQLCLSCKKCTWS